MIIFTIGYEGATQAEVIAALSAAGVELLIDVRAVPLSRRPGFSKNVLASGLREAGIDYIHLKALGTPPEGREAARKRDYARLAGIYAGQLELPEALAQTDDPIVQPRPARSVRNRRDAGRVPYHACEARRREPRDDRQDTARLEGTRSLATHIDHPEAGDRDDRQ